MTLLTNLTMTNLNPKLLTVLLLFFSVCELHAQEAITGTVTDAANDKPLPGVNISVKGTTIGTSSSSEGKYKLNIESLTDTLVFSFIGYETQEIFMNGRNSISIAMEPSTVSAEELVVVGYGTQKKSDLTGSISSLDQTEVNTEGSVTNVSQMIQGRVAGVEVTQGSAAPGGGTSIRIRGATSISTNNSPLFVVDGIPLSSNTGNLTGVANFNGGEPIGNPLNTINPKDISSIEVLKGPSATAIYGARGSNGVVLITTKNGNSDRLNVDYGYSVGRQVVGNRLNLLNTGEYVDVINELEQARGNQAPINQDFINSVGDGTNWQDVIFRSAPVIKHDLSLSGGAENTTYYVSFNYMNQDGVIKSSNFKKYVGRINLDYQEDKFNFGVKLNTGVTENDLVATGTGFNNTRATTIYAATNTPPTFGVYDDNGNFIRPTDGEIISAPVDNPLAVALGLDNLITTNQTYGSGFAEYNFLPTLSARINLGYERKIARADAYNTTMTISGQATNGGATIRDTYLQNTLGEFTLNYKNDFADHSLDAFLGYTYQQFTNEFNAGNITGFPVDLGILKTNNLGLGDNALDNLVSNKTVNRIRSYVGRVNYNYKSRYLVTGSLRADGSSNFGSNNRFGFFPSVAVAWNPLEEDFIPDSDLFSNLKLRASWGKTGNDQIGIGQTLATYSISGAAVFGNSLNTGIAPSRIPNPDLKWETTDQINFGVDFGLLEDRINASIDVFSKNTKDLLINLPIARSTGFNNITTNIGEIQNKGIEVSLNTINLNGPFRWSTDINFSTLKNEVKDLGPLSRIVTGVAVARPGDPLFSYFGYEAEGIFQTEEEVANSAQADLAVPGVPKWKDLNNDGQIGAEDRTILGSPIPDYTLGINNTFNFKNFVLSFFFEGKFGQELFNQGMVYSLYPNDPYRNRLADPLLNRWTPDNPTNEWPSSVDPNIYQGDLVNSFTVEDASYVRLKNLQFTYNVPVDRFEFLRNASISVSGQNLLLFTGYHGFDPDVNTNGEGNVKVDRNSYPKARAYNLSINLGF